ncbi:MAG: hypothetical protein CM15mP74_03300 [Halieaceae bacterium]|nr:MAG: hypothetical protein CM15mP74_03300 [Halieaceae bacterium]
MILSENWLREWVNPELDTEALAHTLTMAGLEVDAVTPLAEGSMALSWRRLSRLNPTPMPTSCAYAASTLAVKRYRLYAARPMRLQVSRRHWRNPVPSCPVASRSKRPSYVASSRRVCLLRRRIKPIRGP